MRIFWTRTLLVAAALSSAAPSCGECAGQCRREYDTCVEYALDDLRKGNISESDYASIRRGCSDKYEDCAVGCSERVRPRGPRTP